jgi:hypothetical protein
MKHATLLFALVATFMVSALFAPPVAQAVGTDIQTATMGLFAGILGLSIAGAMFGTSRTGQLATGFEIADLLSQYQNYYVDRGQNQTDVLRSFLRTRTMPSFAQKRYTKNDVAQLSNAFMSSVLQPFHKTTSGKGTATFIPNEIRLRKIKIDLPLTPDDIEESYLGFMASLSEGDRSKWPIVRYVWEVLVAEKAQEDYEEADWAGEYLAAPGGGTPGSHLDIYDGIKKLVTDGLANGDNPMHELTLSDDPTSTTEVFAAVESVAKQLPQHWAKRKVDLIMPEEMQLNYLRDKRNTHGQVVTYTNESETVTIDFRKNWRLVSFGGMDMAGDNYIIATPTANLLHYQKTDSWRMDMQRRDREALILADWFEGLGFGVNDLVYAYVNEASAS